MRILITGSRDWTNQNAVYGAIHMAIFEISELIGSRTTGEPAVTIVHGHCPTGADAIANRMIGLEIERHPADWEEHGRAAGPIRNAEMVALGADVCLAFIKNNSKGATGCALLAEKAGIPTRRFFA